MSRFQVMGGRYVVAPGVSGNVYLDLAAVSKIGLRRDESGADGDLVATATYDGGCAVFYLREGENVDDLIDSWTGSRSRASGLGR